MAGTRCVASLQWVVDRMERELGVMIRFSYAELDRRIRTLEEGFATLQERVARVETRQS